MHQIVAVRRAIGGDHADKGLDKVGTYHIIRVILAQIVNACKGEFRSITIDEHILVYIGNGNPQIFLRDCIKLGGSPANAVIFNQFSIANRKCNVALFFRGGSAVGGGVVA